MATPCEPRPPLVFLLPPPRGNFKFAARFQARFPTPLLSCLLTDEIQACMVALQPEPSRVDSHLGGPPVISTQPQNIHQTVRALDLSSLSHYPALSGTV